MKIKLQIVDLVIFFLIFVTLSQFSQALSTGSCTPDACPEGYQQSNTICTNGKCYVTCNFYNSCGDTFTTVYTDSEYLPNLNIPSFFGWYYESYEIGSYVANDTSKCYRFRHTTPNNFISSSDIDNYGSLADFDAGIALFWADYNRSLWYNNQRYYSTAEKNEFVGSSYSGAVWADSCGDDGDNFDSADSFVNSNYLYCAPNNAACQDLNSSCDTDCYNSNVALQLTLTTGIDDGFTCNNFAKFDNTGVAIGGDIDFVNFTSQTVYFYVDAADANLTDSFNSSCEYWPRCNPADPCCDSSGNIRPNGFVCKSAHNAVCNSATSGGCDGDAYEDRCDGTSPYCPDNNYAIDYDATCNDVTCLNASCTGNTFQPARTCDASVCQTNNVYECPNNLKCLDSAKCKQTANSTSDCKSGYVYDATSKVCWVGNTTSISLIYDRNGNLISDLDYNYSYDEFNRLSNVTSGGLLLVEYFYDDQGVRIKKVEYDGGTKKTYYLGNFVQVANASGIYNETYYYLYDKLIGKKDAKGEIFYYHPDALGSTDVITNASGGAVESLDYEPFGQLTSSSSQRYTYTGHEKDSETDLLYMQARYQDPDMARFIQPDNAIGDIYNPQDLNKYAYARNNPYKYKDGSGNYVETIIDISFIGYDIYELRKDPRSVVNWLSLGGDVASAALPFVAGGGIAVRGGAKALGKADEISGAARFVSKVDEVSDVTKVTLETDKSSDAYRSFTKRNFRENVLTKTGESGIGKEVHHNLPVKFEDEFVNKVGLPRTGSGSIHDPQFGSVVEKTGHRKDAAQFNNDWQQFFKENPGMLKQKDVLEFAQKQAREYGYAFNF